MVDNPQSANPNASSPESSSGDSTGEASQPDEGGAGQPESFSSKTSAGDDAADAGPFRGRARDSSEAPSESFEGPSFEDFLSEATEGAAGSTASSGPGRPQDRESNASGAGFAYEMAKMWIRDHQKAVMVGAFATGVFLGALMRD